MSSPDKPEHKNSPDDVQLKKEIDAISTRIDRIMETIKPHLPINQAGLKADDNE